MKTMSRTSAPASLAIALFGTIVALAGPHSDAGRDRPRILRRQQCERSLRDGPGSGRKTTGSKTRGFTDSTTPNSGQTSGAANSDAPTGSETPGAANNDAPTGGKTPGGE